MLVRSTARPGPKIRYPSTHNEGVVERSEDVRDAEDVLSFRHLRAEGNPLLHFVLLLLVRLAIKFAKESDTRQHPPPWTVGIRKTVVPSYLGVGKLARALISMQPMPYL